MSSGSWAGAGAARFAAGRPGSPWGLRPAGGVGLRPERGGTGPDQAEVVRTVQDEVLPYDKNLLRTGHGMRAALDAVDDVWRAVREGLRPADPSATAVLRAREAAAMTAHARWMYTAALARTESRGMHKRADFPDADPAQHHRLRVWGLDTVSVEPEPLGAAAGPEPLAVGA